MKTNISILGCGWLGMPLAVHLVNQGFQIKGSTTTEGKLNEMKKAGILPFLVRLDLLPSDISEFLSSDILIINIPSKNIAGYQTLLQLIEKSTVKKILFVSSTSVYVKSGEILHEESDLNFSDLVEIENLFKENRNFITTILRFGGLFGYNRIPGNFYLHSSIIPKPNGFMNMIHRDDCIRIMNDIIHKNIWGDTFNACADTHPTRRNFFSSAALKTNVDLPPFDENDLEITPVISNLKLKNKLNFAFKYPDIIEALDTMG